MLPIGKVLERTDGIVADGRYSESPLPDRIESLLQLHELDFTEGSPIRGTEKDQHGAAGTHDRFESLNAAVLVDGGKCGNLLADSRAGLDVLPIQCGDLKCRKPQPAN
jgi:hypothetical protein